jgi:zeaxanthin glucosyltransferase
MPVEKKWHFGIVMAGGTGHLHPFLALAQELAAREHGVTFFAKPKLESRIREAGFDFVPVSRMAAGRPEIPTHPGRLRKEIACLRSNLTRFQGELESFLEQAPNAIGRTRVNVLMVDEIALTGPTIAQLLGLPYFVVSTSVPHYFGWRGFSWISGYRSTASWLSVLEGVFLEQSVSRMSGPIRRTVNAWRRKAGLEPTRGTPQVFPPLAHISQMPECVDVPRESLPANFHYAGPFLYRPGGARVEFPWNRLDGRPMIYASLGTTRNVRPAIFRLIADACHDLDVQLVIALGNRGTPDLLIDLPGHPIVAQYAPQLELLERARLVITHGGSNTVFEVLLEGKPMIAIPLAFDQPAVAARLRRLGIAEVLPVMRLTSRSIRDAIVKVLRDPSYRDAAERVQARLQQTRGTEYAADIMERYLEEFALRRVVKRSADGRESNGCVANESAAESNFAH